VPEYARDDGRGLAELRKEAVAAAGVGDELVDVAGHFEKAVRAGGEH
jgi:hypothetical protein